MSKRRNNIIVRLLYICLLLVFIGCKAKSDDPSSSAEMNAKPSLNNRLNWFKEAKFGMFIHWGLYSVPAGEWKGKHNYAEWIMLKAGIPSGQYEKFAKQFNPVKFDAHKWVSIAKAAGMKYIVITAKHHDGFSMYDSKYTDYDIIDATPYDKDPLKELSEECKKAGLKFCVYYSLPDWHYPDFPSKYNQIRSEYPDGYPGNSSDEPDIEKYATYMQNQVRELLTNYGTVGILWFDGGGSFRNYDRKSLLRGGELVDMIHRLQPQCLINNRLGFGADYGTPEQAIPEGQQAKPFEVCMTLNDHWGYNKSDNDWKDAETVIHNLADIASKGGNYLLNVGPTSLGVIPDAASETLQKVGNWLKVNGESIYGVKAGPSHDNIRMRRGVMTRKPGKLYLHVINWPSDQTIFMEGMKGNIVEKVYLLADHRKKSLDYDPHERSLFIHVPEKAPGRYDNVIVVEYDKDNALQTFYR